MTTPSNLGGLSALGKLLIPQPPPKEDDPYFAALGRFIVGYATAEHEVHKLARKLARVTDAKGRIIFSGMRLGDLAERVRGLLRATKASKKFYDEIDACIAQLDLVSAERNKLVHRFVVYRSGKIFVTNYPIAKSAEASENEVFELHDLENMNNDCFCINVRLTLVRDRKLKAKMSREANQWLRGPWRYKPPQPAPKLKQRPSVPQPRKHQPPASGG